MSKNTYQAPQVVEIGSVHELTLARRVKVTQRYDGFVNANNDNIGRSTDPVVS